MNKDYDHFKAALDAQLEAEKQKVKEAKEAKPKDMIDAITQRYHEGKKISTIVPNQALRYNSGKLQWSLLDFESLEGLVRVLEYGAKKYSRNNWKKGMPVTQVSESLMRHLFAFLNGEDIDPESGCRHISHVMCNAMFIEYILREKPHYDDRENSIDF